MANYIPFDRNQSYLLPPDLKEWVPADDLAHFVLAASERVSLDAFVIAERSGGKPQYHPRLMLALLIYCYANGLLSSRRIERATYRDVGVRFVAANLHPDHDTIATFRRANKAAFEAAFLEVLLLARESGLLRMGGVSIDGTKIDADASKIRSVRYDRARALRTKLAADIAELVSQAETADQTDVDPQAMPAELARREALKAKLDAACARMEAEARAKAEAERPDYEAKRAAYDAKKGRRGRRPKPPSDEPRPDQQSNLTDPDSALMRRSMAHELRQAYNAQAVVCAEGTQLILATNLTACKRFAAPLVRRMTGACQEYLRTSGTEVEVGNRRQIGRPFGRLETWLRRSARGSGRPDGTAGSLGGRQSADSDGEFDAGSSGRRDRAQAWRDPLADLRLAPSPPSGTPGGAREHGADVRPAAGGGSAVA